MCTIFLGVNKCQLLVLILSIKFYLKVTQTKSYKFFHISHLFNLQLKFLCKKAKHGLICIMLKAEFGFTPMWSLLLWK